MTPVIKDKYEVNEKEFYRIYFNIFNIKLTKKLTPQEIEVLSIICSKPMNFLLDSKKSPVRKSRKHELADDLGVERTAIYGFLKGLVSKGLLIKKSDDFLELPEGIQKLRAAIKANPKPFMFDYTFNFTVQ